MRYLKYLFFLSLIVSQQLFAQSSAGNQSGGGTNPTNCTGNTTMTQTSAYINSYCGSTAKPNICFVESMNGTGQFSGTDALYNAKVYWGCSCPSGTSFIGGKCVSTSSVSSASSASSQGECLAPKIKNISTGVCENKAECIYPKLYDSLGNSCLNNPDFCPPNSKPFASGQCFMLSGDHSCPAGWHDAGGACAPDAVASSAAANSSSGVASSVAASSGQASSTATGSSGSNTSTPSNSNGGGGNPNSPNNIATTNCQLTFGVDRCAIAVGSGVNACPNNYTVNGVTFCIIPASSSGNASSAGGAGGSSGSGSSAGKGECDPSAKNYDECMKRYETPDATATAKIKTDFETDTKKKLDDYAKAITDDIDGAKTDGVPFRDAANALKSAISSHMPQAQGCSPVVINFPKYPVTLKCEMFEIWKTLFAWFLSISTCLYIYHLSMRPIER